MHKSSINLEEIPFHLLAEKLPTKSLGRLSQASSLFYNQFFPTLQGKKYVALACGYHNVALCANGTVDVWGSNFRYQLGLGDRNNIKRPTQIPHLTQVKQVSASEQLTLFLLNDGSVKGCGFGGWNQLGNWWLTILGTNDEKAVVGEQCEFFSFPIPITLPAKAKKVVASYLYSVFLLENNHIVVLGDWNSLPFKKVKYETFSCPEPIKDISVGAEHILCLTTTHHVYAYGSNKKGQLGLGEKKEKQDKCVQIPDLEDVVSVSASASYSLFLLRDGTVKATGRNDKGQLGIHGCSTINKPTRIPDLTDVTQVATGTTFNSKHTLFLLKNKTVMACGYNEHGQLGLGHTTDQTIPTLVPNLDKVKRIIAGCQHTLFEMENNQFKGCGFNAQHSLGFDHKENQLTPVEQPFIFSFSDSTPITKIKPR